MSKIKLVLIFALVISLTANAFLFKRVVDWQEAWAEQILTTSHIERLYKKSGADVSFDSVKLLVEKELGECEIVPLTDRYNIDAGNDKEVILIHGTRLYFKDGVYIGSKANLPSHLEHWHFGQEGF